jgi:hypothetical protein
MTKKEKKQCEICRVVTAKDLNMAPDDIDLVPLFNCFKRAIKKAVFNKRGCRIIVKPINDKEDSALQSPYAQYVFDKLLSTGDANFDNVVKEWHKK